MSANTQQTLPPLYSLTAIGIATFLGSVVAAGYMLASNYAALGQQKLARYVLSGSVGSVVLLIFLSSLWATTLQAATVFLFIQVAAALLVTNKLQGPMFRSYEEMGGKYHSNWRAVPVAIGTNFVLIIAFLLVFALFGTPQGTG